MDEAPELTELQLEVMEVLWSRGEATVLEVQEAIRAERGLAHSTVATLLSRLEKRGLIDHRVEGRQFFYRPIVSRDAVRETMVEGVVDRLFGGSAAAMLAHFLGTRRVDPQDLAQVKALIERQEREARE
ncbi:MAG TPA: BlaI/MecI/CopY family transcriptional regulator [Longimicrobiaceae bacterium]|nr:BlaI/MecI/CopY family transcriptional regulator [Longimicrobiaceae bacterium]